MMNRNGILHGVLLFRLNTEHIGSVLQSECVQLLFTSSATFAPLGVVHEQGYCIIIWNLEVCGNLISNGLKCYIRPQVNALVNDSAHPFVGADSISARKLKKQNAHAGIGQNCLGGVCASISFAGCGQFSGGYKIRPYGLSNWQRRVL